MLCAHAAAHFSCLSVSPALRFVHPGVGDPAAAANRLMSRGHAAPHTFYSLVYPIISIQVWEILERRRPFEGLTQHAVQVRRRVPTPPGVCRMPPPGRSLHDHRRGVHCLASVGERHHAGLLAGSASRRPISTLPRLPAAPHPRVVRHRLLSPSVPLSILLCSRRPSGWQTPTLPACRPCACPSTWTRRASASTAAWRVGAGQRPCCAGCDHTACQTRLLSVAGVALIGRSTLP